MLDPRVGAGSERQRFAHRRRAFAFQVVREKWREHVLAVVCRGRAAEAVGQKLKSLSASHQVLCITHLPQIACFADQHYIIEKTEKREAGATRVHTSIRLLNASERTQEIARMLSGAQLTDTSLKHAQQMLKARG